MARKGDGGEKTETVDGAAWVITVLWRRRDDGAAYGGWPSRLCGIGTIGQIIRNVLAVATFAARSVWLLTNVHEVRSMLQTWPQSSAPSTTFRTRRSSAYSADNLSMRTTSQIRRQIIKNPFVAPRCLIMVTMKNKVADERLFISLALTITAITT